MKGDVDMLDQEKAVQLSKKVNERLEKSFSDDKLTTLIMKIAVRSTIITLQEYEKMMNDQQS